MSNVRTAFTARETARALGRFVALSAASALAAGLMAALQPAYAAMGLRDLPGLDGDAPVTVFYPAAGAEHAVERGPFTVRVAPDAPPAGGNGRLIVVSHGSGGAPWVHTDLARALVEAGYTVAMPLHRGDHWRDDGTPGPESWARRPGEVSRAIDAVGAEPAFAATLKLDRVGLFGQSAGGHTALSLAGGRWSPARFLRHCEAHLAEDFNACVGTATRVTGGWLDGPKRALARAVLRHRYTDEALVDAADPRIAAAVAGVPSAAHFDPDSLRAPRIPLGLIRAGQDVWLHPQWHIDAVAAACVPCERVADLPDAAHNLLLSPLPPADKLDNVSAVLLADPPGYARAEATARLQAAITRFFERHLPPPARPAPVQALAPRS